MAALSHIARFVLGLGFWVLLIATWVMLNDAIDFINAHPDIVNGFAIVLLVFVAIVGSYFTGDELIQRWKGRHDSV